MSQLGCRKDKPDSRDYKITRMRIEQVAVLPKSVDYTDKMSPVGNQFNEGSCVGFACADGMKEYQDKLELGQYVNLSVRYVYNHAKEIDGYPDEEGTEIRCAMKILKDKGVCPEDCWRYVPHINGSPCSAADELAKAYKIGGYWRIYGFDMVQALKESLVANGPCVIGILVFKGIFNAPGGIVPMPIDNEQYEGGHAVTLVGYDDARKLFKFKNSWGGLWGDKGYGYLHYEYIEPNLMDAWSAKDALSPPPPKPWWVRLWEWITSLFKKA